MTMRRRWVVDALLAALLVALWRIDAAEERGRADARAHDSAFHHLGEPATVSAGDVLRFELHLPEGSRVASFQSVSTWTYVRGGDGWRMPQYHDGLAVAQKVDGLLAAWLESRGTQVGSLPDDGAHFELVPGKTLDVDFFATAGTEKPLLHVSTGGIAPGQRAGECFMAAANGPAILQMNANPWERLDLPSASTFPPLLDTHVLAGAQAGQPPEEIRFEGEWAPFRAMVRRKASDEERRPGPGGPGGRFDWFAESGDGETRIESEAAMRYIARIHTLEIDELIDPAGVGAEETAAPVLTLTIASGSAGVRTVVVSPPDAQGRHTVTDGGSHQTSLVSEAKARELVPADLTQPPSRPPGTPATDVAAP